VTGAQDRRRLTIDEDSERVPVTGQDGRDDAASLDVDGLGANLRGFVAFDRADSGWGGSFRR
jgi:hypothetical protein